MKTLTAEPGKALFIYFGKRFRANSVGRVVAVNKSNQTTTLTSNTKFFDSGTEFFVPASYLTEDNLPAVFTLQVMVDSIFTTIGQATVSLPASGVTPDGPVEIPERLDEDELDARFVNEDDYEADKDFIDALPDVLANFEQAISDVAELVFALPPSATLAPSYAEARTSPYDSVRGVYGSVAAKQKVRAAMGHALSGAALVPLLCVGDSETAGWKGTPGLDDPVTTLRNLTKTGGFPTTGGWIYPANGTTTTDTRVTFSGTWSGKTATNSNFVYASAQNAYVQWAPDQTGTVVEITAFCTATQNIDYSIDGGTAVTVSCVQGAIRKFTVTGLTNATHTVRVTKTAPSGTLWVGPARVRATTGLSVTNAGIFGALSSDWLPTAFSSVYYNPYNLSVALETPKIVLIGLGANEALNSGTPAAVATRLNTIIAAYQSLGAVVILKTYMPPADSIVTAANPGYVWTDYVKAMYDVADTNNIILIDHTEAFGDYVAAKAAGLMFSDNIHPLGPGYSAIGRRDYQAITSV